MWAFERIDNKINDVELQNANTDARSEKSSDSYWLPTTYRSAVT